MFNSASFLKNVTAGAVLLMSGELPLTGQVTYVVLETTLRQLAVPHNLLPLKPSVTV